MIVTAVPQRTLPLRAKLSRRPPGVTLKNDQFNKALKSTQFKRSFNNPSHIQDAYPSSLSDKLPPVPVSVIPVTRRMLIDQYEPTGQFTTFLKEAIEKDDFERVLKIKLDRSLHRELIHLKAIAKREMNKFLQKTDWPISDATYANKNRVMRGSFKSTTIHNPYTPDYGAMAIIFDKTDNEIYKEFPPTLIKAVSELMDFSLMVSKFFCRRLDETGLFPEISFYESLKLSDPSSTEGLHTLLVRHPIIPFHVLKKGETSKTLITRNPLHSHPFGWLSIVLPFEGGKGAIYSIREKEFLAFCDTVPDEISVFFDYPFGFHHYSLSETGEERWAYPFFLNPPVDKATLVAPRNQTNKSQPSISLLSQLPQRVCARLKGLLNR